MNARTMRRLRTFHRYLGLFFAPAILFFAVTGGIQTLGFQDRAAGYVPPRWVAVLAGVHKHQAIPKPKPAEQASSAMPAPPAAVPASAPAPVRATLPSPWPLRIFVLLLSIGLTLASSVGIVIALTPRSSRTAAIVILAAGTVVPVLLLFL